MQSSHKRSGQFQDTTYLYSANKSLLREQTEQYLNKTPVRNQYNSSATKSKSNRASQAKRAIDDVITMVADKRRLNQEAISEIKNVNAQIVSNYSGVKSNTKVQRSRKTSELAKNVNVGENISTSLFQWRNSNHELQNSRKQSETYEQNLNLRSRLNEQLRRNNELFQYVAQLQQENNILKSSRHQFRESSPHSLIQENRLLRDQLQGQRYQFLTQLQRLKQENALLRKQTINLLKSKSP